LLTKGPCELVISLKESIDLLSGGVRWWRARRNPVRMQVGRLLETLDAHGVSCTEVNALIPFSLRLNAICWSSPEHLERALTQGHVDWVNEYFDLDPKWLVGRAQSPHRLILSYKVPQLLHDWFEAELKHGADCFCVHLITSSPSPFDQTARLPFSVVLERFFEVGEGNLSKYYYLTAGAAFDHDPCVLHLMQIFAIAHYHKVIIRRSLVPESDLWSVSNGEGLIPVCLSKNRGTLLVADYEFWGHLSGDSPWLQGLRSRCDASVLAAGLQQVVDRVREDRSRYRKIDAVS